MENQQSDQEKKVEKNDKKIVINMGDGATINLYKYESTQVSQFIHKICIIYYDDSKVIYIAIY